MCSSELCLIHFFKVSLQESSSQMLLTDPFPYCFPWACHRQHKADISVMSISTWVCKTCSRRVGQTDCLFLAPSNYGRKKDTHSLKTPLAKCGAGPVLAGQVLPECPRGSVHSMYSSPAPPPSFPRVFPFWLCCPQARYHLCSAGWLDSERVGYPTAFSSPNCGSGYVGIVDYGRRVNLSETWDVFCYREKGRRVLCLLSLHKWQQQPRFWFFPLATGC